MNAPKIKLALFALTTLFLLPSSSHAATAVAVTDNTGLFAINFEIEAEEDYLIPIGAMHGIGTEKAPTYVGYKLFAGDTEVTEIEKTAGIVLGTSPIVDDMYYEVKAGEKKTFTLFLITTITDKAPSSENYRAEITKLPYFRGDTKTQLAKESIEMLDLRSDKIRLNKFDQKQQKTGAKRRRSFVLKKERKCVIITTYGISYENK